LRNAPARGLSVHREHFHFRLIHAFLRAGNVGVFMKAYFVLPALVL
jgi:hypothetical protein